MPATRWTSIFAGTALIAALALPTAASAAEPGLSPGAPASPEVETTQEHERSSRRDRSRKERRRDRSRRDRDADAEDGRHARSRADRGSRSDHRAYGPRVRVRVLHHHPAPPHLVVRSTHRHAPVVEAHPHVVVRHRERPERSVKGDLTSGWTHIGGGLSSSYHPELGAIATGGRFEAGSGWYTIGFYGGGGLNIGGDRATPFMTNAVGFVGVAIPIPVFHPMLGVKGGGGVHVDSDGPGPQLTLGPQAGFIVRKFDGRPGLRVMFDLEAVWKPTKDQVYPQGMLTFAGVF